MKKKEVLEKFNPDRREFIQKLCKATYVAPAVISVSMLDQKLDLSTAHAISAH